MTFRSLNRLALVAALAFACFAFADPARAQAPTPGAIAAAKELVALKGAAVMFDPLIPGVVESAKNTFVPTHPQLVTQLNEVAKAYAAHFSEQELKDIVAFFKSPVGKKMLAQEPIAIDQSLKAAQSWANNFSDVVLERFRVEMKKKGVPL